MENMLISPDEMSMFLFENHVLIYYNFLLEY